MPSSSSTGEVPPDTTDDEQSRLSRRSSVLVDLMSLFRRSSSFHLKSQQKIIFSDKECDDEDEDEEEDGGHRISKDRILEMIQQKKEIISKLRCQPWSMSRKRKALIVAQKHLKKQEARVSRVQLYRTEAAKKFNQFSRLFVNLKIYLIPWEAKIKRIESHFGSVVSSYFTFLRWTLGVNIILSLIMGIFVVVPEWLADSKNDMGRYNRTAHIKVMPEAIREGADMITTIWDLGGHIQYSLLFYGFYSKETYFGETIQYRVPLAYFLANLVVLAFSFFIILRKMASNARTSKLSSGKTEQYVFNWKAFTGWDYTIGNPETAGNVAMANVIKFREAIAEYNVKQKQKWKCYQILIRIFTNLLVFAMLIFSVWAIRSATLIQEKDTFLKQNAVSFTVSLITLIYPNLFDLIGQLEKHHAKFALKLQLSRVLCLYIVNYFTLFSSLHSMLTLLEAEKKSIEANYQRDLMQAKMANMTYYDVQHRTIRDVLFPSNLTFSYSTGVVPSTTPAPGRPWTTVLPDFGPFGVSAPRAVVTAHERVKNGTALFTAHAIGPKANWTTPAVIALNFTGSYVTQSITPHSAQPYRVSPYEDLCWETVIGQEMTKLVIVDLIMTVASILVIDFFRGLFIRYCNIWWFWNLEKTFPEYGEFKVAENVLHLANNQGMIWLGLFFVPLLPALNNIKLIIIMYIRGWACMTCNVPAKQIFRASRSNNFFLGLLLFMLFMSTLPFGYVIASKHPSKTCGPFAEQEFFYSVVTEILEEKLNKSLVGGLRYATSPGIIIPVIVLLLLVIYFLFSLVRGLREANTDLSNQLTHERTEEKKKIFELAGGKKQKSRGSIFFFTDKKRKTTKAVVNAQTIKKGSGSDEENSKQSLPRSTTSIQKFVPSLGSVSEVDHSDSEASVHASVGDRKKSASNHVDDSPHAAPKLTLKQKFLICIGLADPKKYERIPMEDVEAAPAEEKQELLSESQSSSDSDESDTEKSDDERTASFQTASQGRDGASRADHSLSASIGHKRSYTNRSRQLETEFVVPMQMSPPGESGRSSGSTSSNTSNSRSAGPPNRYLAVGNSSGSPSDSQHSRSPYSNHNYSHYRSRKKHGGRGASRDGDETGDVSTRPPSQDGSFRDDITPANFSDDGTHLHSSYTSAMLSPIMARVAYPATVSYPLDDSDDEPSDRAPLVPHHGTNRESTQVRVSRQQSNRHPKTRPPLFRISSSPPKTPNSDKRKFEVRVCSSPKSKRRPHRRPDDEDEAKTSV